MFIKVKLKVKLIILHTSELINQINIQTFCLTFSLTGAHFRVELKHVAHMG